MADDIETTNDLQSPILQDPNTVKAILNTAVDGIITIDEKGYIQSFNQAAENIFGYKAAEVISRKVNMLMTQTDRHNHDSYITNFMSSGEAKVIGKGREVFGLRKNGEIFPMDLAVSEICLENRHLFTGIVRDISSRKAIENALQREIETRAQIEKDLREAYGSIKKSAEKLEEATKLKTEFLANMSHELRTPMNSIIGFTGRVIKKSGHLLPERQLNNLKIVERNANHLLNLINDVLDISKIEAGKMDISHESFDLNELIEHVMDLNKALRQEKHIKLCVENATDPHIDTIPMVGDRRKLKQVLINLVSNAIKFTDEGRVTIKFSMLNAKNEQEILIDYVLIEIIDTGIGMSEKEVEYVFDAFRQVDGSQTKKEQGTGLGLAITRNIIKILGGKIEVASKVGEGTTMSLWVPQIIENENSDNELDAISFTAHDETIKLPAGSHTVLCVDDEPEVLTLLRDILQDEGYRVIGALSVEDGLRLAKKHNPSLITLDIMMAETDGWQALESLKKDESTQNIPVVMISFSDDRTKAFNLGALDFITKPITPEKLKKVFGQILEKPPNAILYVDDDESTRNLMIQMLEDEPARIVTAADGAEALGILNSFQPDLIFMDLIMPGIDGFEAIKRIQAIENLMNIPICVVTGKTLSDEEIRFLKSRVRSVLSKDGLDVSALIEQINQHTSHSKSEETLS